MKKSKKNPNLRLIPCGENILAPDWEINDPEAPPAYYTGINRQMNKLHHLCDIVFAAVILLEIALLQIGHTFSDHISFGGLVALIVAGLVIGVLGSLLLMALSQVETNVRRHLEDADPFEEVAYVSSLL